METFLKDIHSKGEVLSLDSEDILDIEFQGDEIQEFLPEEPIKSIEMKPSYLDRELNLKIEIPDKNYIKDIKFKIKEKNGKKMHLYSISTPFELDLIFDRENKKMDMIFTLNYIDKPISEIYEYIHFHKSLNEGNLLIIKDIDNNILLNSQDISSYKEETLDKSLINLVIDLNLIESLSFAKFILPKSFSDEDINYMLLVKDILSKGNHKFSIQNVSLTTDHEGAENILKQFENEGYLESKQNYKDVQIVLFDNIINLGNLEYQHPPLLITNIEEIKKDITQLKEKIIIKMNPKEDNKIVNVTKDID